MADEEPLPRGHFGFRQRVSRGHPPPADILSGNRCTLRTTSSEAKWGKGSGSARVTTKPSRARLPYGPEKWQLFSVVDDPGETRDVADELTELLKKLQTVRDRYAEDVGVVLSEG